SCSRSYAAPTSAAPTSAAPTSAAPTKRATWDGFARYGVHAPCYVEFPTVARPVRAKRAWRAQTPMRTLRRHTYSGSRAHLPSSLLAVCGLPGTVDQHSRATRPPNAPPPLATNLTGLAQRVTSVSNSLLALFGTPSGS